MGFFVYNFPILSRRMFFSSGALDSDEFTPVNDNILRMNTHSRIFQKPLHVFLTSASLIYSLQVRCVTVLRVSVIGFYQSSA